ncbi:MAG: hypothetical protein WAW61_22210 [Methylococcaceae bacterium]
MGLPTLPTLDRTSATFTADVSAFFNTDLPAWSDAANAMGTALSLNSVTDTSVTSNAIGLGAKTFTASPNKSFQGGMYLSIADSAAPSANSMTCQVTSYNGSTGELIVNSLLIHGTGTKTAWSISMASDPSGATPPAVSGDISVTSITSSGKMVSTSPTAGIGYDTGAGGAVTVSGGAATINKICGVITLASESIAGFAQSYQSITNSAITSLKDIVVLSMTGTNAGFFTFVPYITATGSFVIAVTNTQSGSHNTTGVIVNYSIIRNVNA